MKRRLGGYTIIEVMIVLAVSGGLLISAIVMLGGKQIQTQSAESVRSFESSVEAISREVSSGFYPSSTGCTVPAFGPVDPTAPGGASGGNTGCIFLGKVFSMASTSGTSIDLIGRQFVNNSTTDDVSKLSEAQPVKLLSGATQYEYLFDLKVTAIFDSTDVLTAEQYQALAYITELGGGSSIADNPVNGSRGIQLYGIPGTVAGNVSGSAIDISTLTLLPEGAIICLKTTNDKYAEITVGLGGNQYTTNTLIDTGVDNVCKI